MGRYVSEAWFGRQLARQPPAHGRVHNGSTRHAQPELARPAGMALIITETALLLGTGTVLLLTVPVQLPVLNVKLLGLIMIVGGLVKARTLQQVSSWLWRNRRERNGQARPEPTRPAGMALIITGAVLLLAVSVPLPVLTVKLPGLIMIVAGLVKARALPQLSRPPGMALISLGTVLLLAVSVPLPVLNVKLLGLIIIVGGLVKARAPQQASSWLWRNRRGLMAALVPPEALRPGARGEQWLEQRRHRLAGADQLAGGGSRSPLSSLPITKRMVSATLLTR